jgi:L-threonylcarbamoyladenylate synthase
MILKLDGEAAGSAAPPSSAVAAALEALRAGLVIAVPTDTVYGLAADVRSEDGIGRLFAIKGRPVDVALPLLVSESKEIGGWAEMTPAADRLTRRFWPGPLTVVVARRAGIEVDLGGDAATIGLRCPAHAPLRGLLWRSRALAVTSANLHGEPALHTARAVAERFGDRVAVVLDGGRCEGRSSTVVSLVGLEPTLLRPGAIAFDEIIAALA